MGDVATEKAQGKAADSGEPSTSSSVPSSETPAPSSKMVQHKKPVVIIVIGMAGCSPNPRPDCLCLLHEFGLTDLFFMQGVERRLDAAIGVAHAQRKKARLRTQP